MAEKVKKIKNREASKTYKGYRFQKIRLARRMLEMITENEDLYIIGFPEHWEDLYIMGEDSEKLMEQDKEYSTDFSLNSEVVRKAFISFLDIYLEHFMDANLKFVFHTNVDYTKERTTEFLKDLNLKPLEESIFSYLINREYEDKVIEFMSKIIVQTYKQEYKDEGKYIELIESMTNEEWTYFLKSIVFEFGQESLSELEKGLIEDIKECPFYNEKHLGKEEDIKAVILENIDKRMNETLPLKKAITSDKLKLIFLESEKDFAHIQSNVDPIHTQWDEIVSEKDELDDIRNLRDKICSVCSNFPEGTMKRLNREATTAKGEIVKLNKKQMNSLKTRVYESMERYFDDIYTWENKYHPNDLKDIIKNIKNTVVTDLELLKKDYSYGINNNILIEKMVVMFIDECFYSFDEVQ